MTIDPHLTINQLLQRYPTVLPRLAAAGVDSCCGGDLRIQEAAERAGLDPAALLADLGRDIAAAPPAAACGCGCKGS
jgi:iron-sulfur cluster repair protein YtfE (RIC family)